MKETKNVKQSAGLIAAPQVGKKSSPVMTDGKETPEILLALLNNALFSMTANNQAKIMGKCQLTNGHVATIIFIMDVVPTADKGLVSVGTFQKAQK